MMLDCHRRYRVMMYFWCIGCLLVAGCAPDRNQQASEVAVQPTATSVPFFKPSPTAQVPLSTSVPQPSAPPVTDMAVPTVTMTQVPATETVAPVAAVTQVPANGTETSVTPITTSADPTALADTAQSVYQVFLPGIFYLVSPSLGDNSAELDQMAIPTQDEGIAEIVVYDEALDPNWSTEQTSGVSFNMSSTDYVYNGSVAAAITPQVPFGRFFLTVREDATVAYPYDKILGISFRLDGGANLIENDDLGVTVLGSNAFTYWVPNDTSVQIDREVTEEFPLFSETRLLFLDINGVIPPNTWTEVIVWLDELEFDPIYQYVTGIYLKNDEDFLQTYYIDRVSLLLVQE